jgi:hypothetical protein
MDELTQDRIQFYLTFTTILSTLNILLLLILLSSYKKQRSNFVIREIFVSGNSDGT